MPRKTLLGRKVNLAPGRIPLEDKGIGWKRDQIKPVRVYDIALNVPVRRITHYPRVRRGYLFIAVG